MGEIRKKLQDKYNELKNNNNSPEYEEWFLRYRPADGSVSTSFKKNREKTINRRPKTGSFLKNRRKFTKKYNKFSKIRNFLQRKNTRRQNV